MHSLSILITALIEAFPASPVMIHAHYSHLKFTMLGIFMLRDVPRRFFGGVSEKL